MDFKNQVLKDIVEEISIIKEAIQNKNLNQASRERLFEKRAILQSKLNEILKKRGVLSETEADKIYDEMKLNKKSTLELQSKRGFTSIYIAAAILIVGVYFAFKK